MSTEHFEQVLDEIQDEINFRLELLRRGYEPIPVVQKAPNLREWSSRPITEDRIRREAQISSTGTGLRAGRLVPVDVDLINPEHVFAIIALVERELGPTEFVKWGAK